MMHLSICLPELNLGNSPSQFTILTSIIECKYTKPNASFSLPFQSEARVVHWPVDSVWPGVRDPSPVAQGHRGSGPQRGHAQTWPAHQDTAAGTVQGRQLFRLITESIILAFWGKKCLIHTLNYCLTSLLLSVFFCNTECLQCMHNVKS